MSYSKSIENEKDKKERNLNIIKRLVTYSRVGKTKSLLESHDKFPEYLH